MNLKYRKLIAKIKPIHLMARYLMYNSSAFFYSKAKKEYETDKKLDLLLQQAKRNRCFIIGNGPSLKVEDLNKLIDEDTFAANEIYKIFADTKWRPTYYLVKDRYSKSSGKDIDRLQVKNIFVGDYYLRYHEIKRKDIICIHEHYALDEKNIPFSDNLKKCFYSASTVTYGLMQIAAYLEYKEIYLLGFDHNYSFEFDEKGNVVKTDTDNAHFFKDEIPEDIIANVYGMTRAYESFRYYSEKKGIFVKNATRGGKLEVFHRVDFDSLFSNR